MILPAYKTKIVCTIGPASSSEAVTDKIPVDYKRLPETVIPGSLIFLNDGFIQLRVEKVFGEDVFCKTIIGGPLLSYWVMRFMGKAGMAEKDERVILVEDESTQDMHKSDSFKIISTRKN